MNIDELNQPVASNISTIILHKGLKQKSVAEKARLSKQAFNDMLNGRRLIKMADTLAIAKALGVEVNDLFADNLASRDKGA